MAWEGRCCVAFSAVFISLHLCALVVAHSTDALPLPGGPPARVRVGVMLDLASPAGLRLQTAIRMSLEDYYAVHPDSATRRIELHFRDTPAGDGVAAAVSAAEDLVNNAQVQAIVAPETPAEAELVAAVGVRAHVPVLSYSYAATAPPPTSSFLVRACADDSRLAAPVADVLRGFGWRAAVVVHEDSRRGVGIVAALADAFLDAGATITIAGRAAVPVDASDDRLDAALYRAVSRTSSRVFVVHMAPSLSRRLFSRAKKAGFMSRGHVWIATDGTGGLLNRLGADDVGAMQGALVVRPRVQPTVRASNFAARLNARVSQEMAGSLGVQEDPTLSMLWAYDTAWAVAMAAQAVGLSSGRPEVNRQVDVSTSRATLLKAVLDTTFDGLAGKFRLVDAQLRVPAYEIVNVVPDGAKAVGFWTESSSKITQDLHATNSSSDGLMQIIWPGEQSHSRVPKGLAVSPPTGRDLVVAVPVKHGFNQFVSVSGGDSTNGRVRVTGYCIDVFDAVMKALPSPVSYQYVPFNGSSDSYDQLVGLIPQQKADVVVGDVTITSSRMVEVDYTMPFTESGWSMVVAVQTGTSTSMFFFLEPLTASLWLASFAFFVFTGFVVWVIEHRINPEFRGTPLQQLGLIFYYAFSTLVFAHRERLMSNLSRFVVIIWVFVVLILTSSYTASLTSMLTVQQLQPTLTDVNELIKRGEYVGFQEGSFVSSELKKMNFDESRLRSYSTPDQYAQALSKGSANGGVAAIFDEIPYLKLFLSQYCNSYAMVGPIYKDAGFGFVFPKGSPMAPDVSRAIVSLTEGDEMALIERKWFGNPGACDNENRGGMGSSSLSFWSFSGLFLVTGVASGLMLVVNLAMFIYRERNELRAAESGAGSSSLRRLRAWLQHYDKKDTRSPSFKQWNDGGGGDAKQRTGAGQDQDAIQHTTAPATTPLGGGSGDSDMSAEASCTEEVANAKCGQDIILQANDGGGRRSQGSTSTREVCT